MKCGNGSTLYTRRPLLRDWCCSRWSQFALLATATMITLRIETRSFQIGGVVDVVRLQLMSENKEDDKKDACDRHNLSRFESWERVCYHQRGSNCRHNNKESNAKQEPHDAVDQQDRNDYAEEVDQWKRDRSQILSHVLVELFQILRQTPELNRELRYDSLDKLFHYPAELHLYCILNRLNCQGRFTDFRQADHSLCKEILRGDPLLRHPENLVLRNL